MAGGRLETPKMDAGIPPESGRLGYHFLLSFFISYGYRQYFQANFLHLPEGEGMHVLFCPTCKSMCGMLLRMLLVLSVFLFLVVVFLSFLFVLLSCFHGFSS